MARMSDKKGNFTEAFAELPESIRGALRTQLPSIAPKKVALFGSRARGSTREHSDYDLVFWGDFSEEAWTSFCLALTEAPLTLYKLDLLRWEKLDSKLQQEINNDMLVLYEHSS